MSWLDRLRRTLRRQGRQPTLAQRYDEIAREIDPHDLQRASQELALTEADLIDDLTAGHDQTHRISDYYTEEGFQFALERYGLLDRIRDKGFHDLRFTFDPRGSRRHHITCRGTKDGAEHVVIDLMMGRILRPTPPGIEPTDDLDLLSIEWMMLQNPTLPFTAEHPRLPGQDHPGLGLNEEVMLLHIQSARRLALDGVVNHPSRFHVAFIGRDRVWFLDPAIQGRFDALRGALAGLELAEATWKMERGEVRWADDDTVVEWLPEDYLFPTSRRLEAYFHSEGYEERRSRSHERARARGIRVA